ncbi:DEAD/DEAH box helicase family protein [Flexivirga lutea]
MTDDVLDRFSPATRAWFEGSFSAPTPAQSGAWDAISNRDHTLVVAPTGSGKTLSAFLWAIDRMAATPAPEEALRRCRVIYVSPMKALAVDVERNLRSPLVGIQHAADRLGLPQPDVTVSVRSGDTPAIERRAFAKRPTDILITTPESLFLLLTSAARQALSGVETVIIDEVHAVAGTKRGAHLALSLERLDAILPRPAQRIGLSATVRPVEQVARYLTGGRPVTTVQPPAEKSWDLEVVVPVPDLTQLGRVADDLTEPASDPVERASIWPHVEERIVDLIAQHRSTIVFANSRRLAERLTTRLNEIWAERTDSASDLHEVSQGGAGSPRSIGARNERRTSSGAGAPAQVMAQAGQSSGAPAVLARAHHGSVSKEQRGEIEDALKSGRLPAVVATSSLELGIDMGLVDLVIQVESPPSVASGLQRVGRAGHQVGAVSRGVLFPKFRGDLVQTCVVVDRMKAGMIESLAVPNNPVDVLAQQIVAMCALDDWSVEDLEQLAHRTASFASLPRSILESVLDMLAGRYPSEDFAELRPRIVWDRITGTLSGRRGAQRLAVTSGGTIPDRGLYGVFLATGEGPGRRVGELDEEMVYESRVGDVFTLGTTSWRIEDITHDQVRVTPAPGQPGKLPFWRGDSPGRPLELGTAVGGFVRELIALPEDAARARVARTGLDQWAADNLLAYLREQQEATGQVPHDKAIVVERFRDELGDWRVVVHSPYGAPVHAPWALAIAARMRERLGVEVQAMHGDDGIVLRLPDSDPDTDASAAAQLLELIVQDPDEIAEIVTSEIGGSALFAARFRECAARALLLPRRNPGRRQALWQQRQRSAQLLEVAARFPSFPIVLEAVRECVQDVFDVPGLEQLMRDITARRIRVVQVDTATPSPFATSLLFGYVAQFLYEGDSPLAERRAAALALDPSLLADLLGSGEGASLRDLLDAEVVSQVEDQLQRLVPERHCRDAEDVADLVRVLGVLTRQQIEQRTRQECRGQVAAWLRELVAARRLIEVPWAGGTGHAAIEDAARLRDALGVALPAGIPAVFLEPTDDPLGELVVRFARTHAPFPATEAAAALGIGRAVAHDTLRRLVTSGRLVEGELRPTELGGGVHGIDYADPEVLRTIKRRSLASLRAEVEPVPAQQLASFLPQWQGVGGGLRGADGLLRAVEQLCGARVPASALETLILPERVTAYHPGMLDELMAGGEVLWQGHAALPGDDGWVSLHLADTAPLTLAMPDDTIDLTPAHQLMLAALDSGGSFFFRALADAVNATDARTGDAELQSYLWDLIWSGRVSGDTFAPVRALLGGGRTAHKARAQGPRQSRHGRIGGLRGSPGGLGRPASALRTAPPSVSGRWSLLPQPEDDQTARAFALAEVLLDRHGIVTRGAVQAESVTGGFATVYRVLAAAEETGRVRRGYFVEGLGAAQFGSAGAVDRLRAAGHTVPAPRNPWDVAPVAPQTAFVLAAADPANPFGAALPWPDREIEGAEHRPSRRAGAMVVLVEGALVLYVERGGRKVLTFTDDGAGLAAAAAALARTVVLPPDSRGTPRLRGLTVEGIDGRPALGSDHPLAHALTDNGFHVSPKGLRIRR